MQTKENIGYYIIAAIGVSAGGYFLCYLYTLFPSSFAGVFTATNASIFEQMKIFLWPTVIFMAIHESTFKNGDFESQSMYLLLSLVIIPCIILLFSRIFTDKLRIINILAVNIAITVFFSLCYFARFKTQPLSVFKRIAAPILMITIIVIFIAFSFNPPKMDFFKDPNSVITLLCQANYKLTF